jgi:hypothetical protein
LVANSDDLAESQPNPVWVKFDPEADAAYIGLAFISPGEAVRQVIVEGVPNSADIVLDFNSSGHLGIPRTSPGYNQPGDLNHH